MNTSQVKPNLVVIGGGTGTSVVLSGLLSYPVDLTAVITVADSGGSTGRLRDEFGFQAVGDLRQALAALADPDRQTRLRDMLLYRFNRGQGLSGHNLGNLILTALQDLTGSTNDALLAAENIFHLHGRILPSTSKKVDLVVEYADGSVIVGEHHLNPGEIGGKQITRVRLSPRASLHPAAREALLQADVIIIGPGDLYASLMPNLIVAGIKPALRRSHARLCYVLNLMTVFTQTHNLTAAAHVKIIERALGRPLDQIVINRQPLPSAVLKAYAAQSEFPVIDDLDTDPRVIRRPLVITAPVKPDPADPVARSFLRHDPHKLASLIINLCQTPASSS